MGVKQEHITAVAAWRKLHEAERIMGNLGETDIYYIRERLRKVKTEMGELCDILSAKIIKGENHGA